MTSKGTGCGVKVQRQDCSMNTHAVHKGFREDQTYFMPLRLKTEENIPGTRKILSKNSRSENVKSCLRNNKISLTYIKAKIKSFKNLEAP